MACFVCACCAATAIDRAPETSKTPRTNILFIVDLLKTHGSYLQFPTKDRYRTAGQENAVADDRDTDEASSRRCLISHELTFAESRRPVRSQGAMRGTGNWVFVDASTGRKEPRHEIDLRHRRTARRD